MNDKQLIRTLTTIKKSLRRVLEPNAFDACDMAIAQIRESKEKYDRFQKRSDLNRKPVHDWGYAILNPSLRFKIATYKGYQLRPDIICNLRWQEEGTLPSIQELVLRVWSADEHLMYREQYDSEHIGELVTAGNGLSERVMLRCHFDLANPSQSGPKYHLQIGGNPRAGEHGWYPKELDLPRLPHHPLDLILLCQLVVANFFPDEYKDIRKNASWHWAVTTVERYLLVEYYAKCLKAAQNKKTTLMDTLWNAD